jgi:hypothetical protein
MNGTEDDDLLEEDHEENPSSSDESVYSDQLNQWRVCNFLLQ